MSGQPSKSSARAEQRKATKERLERNRRGKKPFTNAQVLARWQRIRDGALVQLEQLIIAGDHKGQLSVSDTIRKAQAEITGLERLLGIGDAGKAKGFDWASSLPDEEPGVEA